MGKKVQNNQTLLSPPTWWRILVLCLLSSACVVFEIITLQSFRQGFWAQNAWWLTILSGVATTALLIASIFFLCRRKETLYKGCLSIFFVLLFFLVVLYIIVKTDFITVLQTPELYQKFLEKTGVWMPMLYILLQFLQVVLLPIPSIVSTLAGIALFGALQTALYSLIGILAGSFLAFFIGKKLGYKAVAWMVGEEELKKWLKRMKGKDNLILTAMFLLPLFPDDVLCFVAGLSTMSWGYFSAMMLISRLISIFTTCFSVNFIPFNTWLGLLIWGILFLGMLIFFVVIYKNIDKINEWLAQKRSSCQSKKRKK